MNDDRKNCEVCDSRLMFEWSDTHGIGVCITCGAPYRIYHYEDDKRVDRPPEITLTEIGMSLAHRYWQEKQRRIFPGMYDMGFSGGRSTTYSGATRNDIEAWNEWYAKQPEAQAT